MCICREIGLPLWGLFGTSEEACLQTSNPIGNHPEFETQDRHCKIGVSWIDHWPQFFKQKFVRGILCNDIDTSQRVLNISSVSL